MNERIRELEKQCWTHRVDGTLVDGQLHFDTKKFSELIVRECAEHALTFNNNLQSLNDKEIRSHASRVSDYIKDRCGVNE